MTFLSEYLNYNSVKYVTEEIETVSGKPKTMYMKGIFIQGGIRNQNGRIYPVNEIRNAVETINRRISENGPLVGESEHPEGININIDRISHVIEEMWMDGPNGYGKLRILGTPAGTVIRTLLEEGVKLGVSSRGEGQVDGAGYVSNFNIVTVDIVVNPSCTSAYPVAILEGLKRSQYNKEIEKLSNAVYDDKTAQKYLKNELTKFINSL